MLRIPKIEYFKKNGALFERCKNMEKYTSAEHGHGGRQTPTAQSRHHMHEGKHNAGAKNVSRSTVVLLT